MITSSNLVNDFSSLSFMIWRSEQASNALFHSPVYLDSPQLVQNFLPDIRARLFLKILFLFFVNLLLDTVPSLPDSKWYHSLMHSLCSCAFSNFCSLLGVLKMMFLSTQNVHCNLIQAGFTVSNSLRDYAPRRRYTGPYISV